MSQSHGAHRHRDSCRNCGAALHGEFCSQCGQAEHEGHPPTVRHFLHELLHELEHVDGKIFRTLKLLLFRPGALTAEYRAGRVVSYVRPIRLFLIAAALHLLISTGVGPLNYHVAVVRSAKGDVNVNIGPDPAILAGTPVADEEIRAMTERFDHAYLSVRYTAVLMFGAASWLFYRKREPLFVSHLIAGLHFYTVWYVLAALASLPGRLQPFWNRLGMLSIVYLFFMLGRLYRESWFLRLLKTLAIFSLLLAAEMALALGAAAWAER